MKHPALLSDDGEKILAYLKKIRAHFELPGISVAVSAAGQTLNVSAGVSNALTGQELASHGRFESGCITKLLTSIVVLHLVARGVLDLHTRLSDLFAELRGSNGDRLSLGHLLSHTAGYRGENFADAKMMTTYSWDDFRDSFNRRKLLFEPGTVYDYSHSASVIAGKVVKHVTGRSASALARELIFDSLGILHSPVRDHSRSMAVPGHVLLPNQRRYVPVEPVPWSTFWEDSFLAPPLGPGELVRIGEELLKTGGVFGPLVAERLMTPVVNLPKLFGGIRKEDVPIGFGMGCAQFTSGVYGLSSSTTAQTCSLRIHSKHRIVVAVGINALHPFARDFLANKLMNALLPVDETAPASMTVPSPFTFAELEGKYQGRLNNSVHVYIEDSQLAVRPEDNPAVTYPTGVPRIAFIRSREGHIVPKDDMAFLSMGFFRDPTRNTPCLMIGGSAFLKVQ